MISLTEESREFFIFYLKKINPTALEEFFSIGYKMFCNGFLIISSFMFSIIK